MVGLDRERVRLEPHRDEWRACYESEVERLSTMVGDRVRRFEHVGSTAVRGMPAKPVIDVLAVVADLDAATALIGPLQAGGYELRSEEGERLFFAKGPETDRTHYLHVAETNGEYAAEMLAFRDHLRENSEAAAAYADLKRALADRFPEDRDSYAEHKTEFVERTLDDALDD